MNGITKGLGLVDHLDPAGSRFICVADHPSGHDSTGGRLLRLRSGIYAINLAGLLRSCDQAWARKFDEQASRYQDLNGRACPVDELPLAEQLEMERRDEGGDPFELGIPSVNVFGSVRS